MPAGVTLVDATLNANAPQVPAMLPAAAIANQNIIGGFQVITGFNFQWGHDITLYAPVLRYIRHEKRKRGDRYLRPMNPSPPARNCLAIKWGVQMNQWRKGQWN
jgi:hypothetical protein